MNTTISSNPVGTLQDVYTVGSGNHLLDFHWTASGWFLTDLTEGVGVEVATPDLRGVEMRQTGSGRTEVHVLSAAANFQQLTDEVATALETTTPEKWAFAWASNGDLFGIAMNQTGSNRTEVHVLSADSNFQQFSAHVATSLNTTAPTEWTFGVNPEGI